MAATVTRNPTSDEAVAGTWSGSAGSRWTLVDDYPDTGGTDILTTSATGGGQITFGFSAFSLPSVATSISVIVDYYDRKNGSQSCNIGARLKIGGSYFNASTHNPSNGSIVQRSDTFATNPATSSAWTPSDVNGIQAFGVNSTDSSPSVDITSIQLRVVYTGDYPLNAAPGSFVLTESDMTFVWQHVLAANAAGFSLSGAPAGLKYNTDPSDFPGLVAWHDASQETGYTDGQTLTTVTDWSGNGRTVKQDAAPSAAIYKATIKNGLGVFRFSDTTNDEINRLIGEGNSLTNQWRNAGYGVVMVVFKPTKAHTKADVVFIEDGTNGVGRFGMAISETGFDNEFTLFGRRLDSDSAQFLNGGAGNGVTANQWYIAVIRVEWANAKAWIYVNNNLLNSTTSFQTAGNTSNTESWSVDISGSHGASYLDGDVGEVAWFNAQWTDQNVTDIFTYANRKWNVYSSLNNYVMPADPAGYTLTGQPLTTLAARLLSLDPNAYILSGAAATLSHGYVFSADPASYALAGQPTNFLWTHVLSANPGSFGLSGAQAGTLYARIFSADPASYALSGAAATMSHGYLLVASPGGLTLSGQPATTLAARLLSLDAGTFALSGAAASTLRSYVIQALAGTYGLTGADVTQLRTYVVQALAGSFALSAPAASTLKGYMLNAAAGSYGVTGADATDLYSRIMSALAGSYVLSGADANLIFTGGGPQQYSLNAQPGAFNLTGFDAALLVTRQMNAQPGSYGLTGADAGTLASRQINAQPATFTLTGSPASTLASRLLSANPGSFTLAGQPIGVIRTYILVAIPGAYALVGMDATLGYNAAVSKGNVTSLNFTVYAIFPSDEQIGGSVSADSASTVVRGDDQ